MNQSPIPTKYDSFGLNRATRYNTYDIAESGYILSPKKHDISYPTNFETIACWNGVYDQHAGALQSWDGAAHFPGAMEFQQTGEKQIAQAVEYAITAERNRLARELHDAVTQTLFAASLIAEVLPDLWEMDEAEAHKSTEELRQLARGALAEMRTLLFELRPAALKQARLPDLLKQLSEAVMGRKRLPICLDVVGDCEIPCDVKVEMYRIAQESLNNVAKYARATRAELKVRLEANQVHMEIKDNGIGFDQACVKPASLGLRIMRERAEAIHAELQVVSLQGQGTTVSLDWHR